MLPPLLPIQISVKQFAKLPLDDKRAFIRILNTTNVDDTVLDGMDNAQLILEYDHYIQDITYKPKYLTGRGLKESSKKKSKRRKIRIISGRGALVEMDENSTTDRKHNENGKYIEMNKLKDNILSLKYSSTNTNVKKPLHVNDDVKTVILNIIDDKFNKTFIRN